MIKQARPQRARSVTTKLPCGCGALFAIVSFWGTEQGDFFEQDRKGPKELFVKLGPQGSCPAAATNALAVQVSILLRCGVPPAAIAAALNVPGPCPRSERQRSCLAVLAGLFRVLGGARGAASPPGEAGGLAEVGSRRTGCGEVTLAVRREGGVLTEAEARLAQSHTCAGLISRGVSRVITLGLSSGVAPEVIAEGLSGISCPASLPGASSCLDAIGRLLVEQAATRAPEGPGGQEGTLPLPQGGSDAG